MRPSGRSPDRLRDVRMVPGASKYAEGSCLIQFGDTHVLCTASVRAAGAAVAARQRPRLGHRRVRHAAARDPERTDREAARGRQTGRTQEIQRLIGRSLRAVTDLTAMAEMQIRVDCDVLQADGGTRTAAITGAYVALHLAFRQAGRARPAEDACRCTDQVAAVSCGIVRAACRCSISTTRRTSAAEADANFVLTGRAAIVEVQGTAEQTAVLRGAACWSCWRWPARASAS